MSGESERERRREALWVRHLAGERVAGEELAPQVGAANEAADLAADERLHRMLSALGRAGADEQAFAERVDALVAAEASGERFVRAVEARIRPRKRPWIQVLRWPLVFAPVALIAVLVAARWMAPRDGHSPVAAEVPSPVRPPTVVTGTLAVLAAAGAAEARLGPGEVAPEASALLSDAGRACLQLGDGSRVCLERGTRLRLQPVTAAERRLVLEAGKAAATVTRRPGGPSFTITTAAAEVTALGTAFSVELGKDGASVTTRVVAGAVAVLPHAPAASAVTVRAHHAHALFDRAPWRMGAEEERDEWSLLRGQTAAAILAATASEIAAPADPAPAPGAPAASPDTGALLALADALRARGRLRDAQGISDALAQLHPGRGDIRRLAAELRAPPAPTPWNATPAVYRINAGGPRFMDPRGNVWSADAHYSGGKAAELWEDIDGTDMDPLYRSERVVFPGDQLAYNLPIADGRYVVRLHFAEIWAGTLKRGMRKFDVLVEGEKVLAAYDIAAEVGPMTATVKQVVTTVRDGSLDIDFRHVVENPKLSGIEVFALPAGEEPPPAPAPPAVYPPLPLPPTDALYRVNVGGREYVDPLGRRWEADDHFSDVGLGSAYDVDVAGTELDPLYQTNRYACRRTTRQLAYHLPAPAGRYRVRLHFVELEPDGAPGFMVFGVQLEGTEVIKSLDVFGEAGLRKALVKEAEIAVEDGVLDVVLRPVTNCAQVAGIEVIPLPTPPGGGCALAGGRAPDQPGWLWLAAAAAVLSRRRRAAAASRPS